MSTTIEQQLASRQRLSDLMRGYLEDALEKLDADPSSEFDVNIESMISSCNHRFNAFTHPPSYWAIDLHDLWRAFIWCAKGTPADDTRQDRRALQILQLRELGVIINTRTEPPCEAITEEGERIWADLPYLAADFWAVWENALDMKASHMNNLAAFTVRLAGVGVRADELAFCMLLLCRQVLETEQPVGGVPLAELLPAVFQWFKHYGEKINRLCISGRTITGEARFSPGPLAQEAGIYDTGFSLKRWLFWRKLAKDFMLSDNEKLATEGRRISNRIMMIEYITQNKPLEASW